MGRSTVIKNVRVFNGEALLGGAKTVVIEGAKIRSIADYRDDTNDDDAYDELSGDDDDVSIVDGYGCTLLPGLIDTHVHISSATELPTCARHGVTTVCDMACMPFARYRELRSISSSASSPTTWLGTSLPAYSATSRHGTLFRFHGVGDEHALKTTTDVPAFIKGRARDGVDYVKIIADMPGGLQQDVLDTIQIEARKVGLMTVAHTAMHEAFERALTAGFDILTHVPMDHAVDESIASRMRVQGTVAIPTLAMMEGFKKSWTLWPLYYSKDFQLALRSVTAMKDAGVPVLAGTDANPFPVVDVRVGRAMHRELELLVQAGLTPAEALRAASTIF
jgi:imidazolonepropionase-like amidohydrolase